jgi:ATPase family associated with various cellular activities (AAA)
MGLQMTKAPKIEVKKQWALNESGQFTTVRAIIRDHIEPGLYEFITQPSLVGDVPVLDPLEHKLITDDPITMKGSLMDYIIGAAEAFWSKAKLYDMMRLVHKRGLLIEGAPGSGKTLSCLMAGRELGKRNGLAIFVAPNTSIKILPAYLMEIREFEPEMPMMVIFEDIDKHLPPITDHTSAQQDAISAMNMNLLLSLLDGEKQVQNVIYIATTNFLDRIDARLTNRPSRFDEIIRAKAPNKAVRTAYFDRVLSPLPQSYKDKRDDLVAASRGLNFAHMKELAISTCIYDRDVKGESERLKNLAGNHETGFTSEED